MNRTKIFLFLMVAMTSAFFCAENVNAAGDGTGYAQCYYVAEEPKSSSVGFGAQAGIHYRPYVVGINFYKVGNNSDSYRSEVSVECGTREDENVEFDASEPGICTLTNQNKYFGENSFEISKYFTENETNHKNPTWKCPSKIGIKLNTANNKMEFSPKFFKENKCPLLEATCREFSLMDEHSIVSQSGTAPKLKIINHVSEKKGIASGYYGNDYGIQVEPGDPDEIKQWAEKYEQLTADQKAQYDNLCNVISEDTKGMIQSGVLIICIVGVLIFLVITMFEFVKGLVSSDDGRLSNLLKRLKVRIICVVVLLLLPVLVTGVINIINDAADGVFGEQDPLCDVIK